MQWLHHLKLAILGPIGRNAIFWLVFTWINDPHFPNLPLYLARLGVIFISFAPGGYLNTLWLLPKAAYQRKWIQYTAGLGATVYVSMAWSWFCAQWINVQMPELGYMGNERMATVGCHFFPVLLVFLLLTLGRLFTDYEQHRSKMFELKKQQVESELLHLRTRIHPHFLFNSMNTLYGVALKSDEQLADSVMQLSDVLRYVIYEAEQPLVPIYQELQFLEQYLEFSKLRMGEGLRIDYGWYIDGRMWGKRESMDWEQFAQQEGGERLFPPLLLLPLVENAVKYAGETLSGDKYVDIWANLSGNRLQFRCVNSIDAIGDRSLKSKGFGLANLQRRLDLMYGRRAQLHMEKRADSYWVEMEIYPI